MDNSEPNNRQLWAVISAVLCFLVLSVGYTLPMAQYIKGYNAKHYEGRTSTEYDATSTQDNSGSSAKKSGKKRSHYSNSRSQQNTDYDDASYENSYSSTANGQGQYTVASERLLTEDDLAGLSARELKIMRNEIFARHGYIFKTEDMKAHFNSQPWYEGRYDDVSSMLSDIEIKNVSFIKRHE